MTDGHDEGTEAKHEDPEPKKPRYVLRLYVAGTSRKSLRAMQNLKKVIDEELVGEYELEIMAHPVSAYVTV